ncbi:protein prenyltransferase alpha subunit repeat-containing protein 1, partial [Aplysia californica]|uniref:Protein prenyltransferase alpha subunit repeat-containing protein 1 n=1 Tax=Aplysia californica TaxID=6500 RepID=A0ABM1AFW1_APLCA
ADSRGPRLLTDLNNAFRRDPNIDEYDILPVLEPKHNKCPFILRDHKLGVEAWAVKVLLKYAANRLIGWRGRLSSEKFLDSIELCNLSRAVLLFNPDNYTAWNIRKELIENSYLSISDDLMLGALILSKHPKSPETFIHRRWLFQQLLDHCLSSSSGSNTSCSAAGASTDAVNMEAIDVDVSAAPEPRDHLSGAFSLESSRLLKSHTQRELEICGGAADHYPSNYHAWSHRIWVVQHCLNSSLQVLLYELKMTEDWTRQHISDHSGFHYRQFLLSEIHRQRARLTSMHQLSSADLYSQEMAYVCDLIESFPGHEALWCHRRCLFQTVLRPEFLEANASTLLPSLNGHVPAADPMDTDATVVLRSAAITQELEHIVKTEGKNSHNYQETLAANYGKWLQKLL